MQEWLQSIDSSMRKKAQNSPFFLDNAPSPPAVTLKNVKLLFYLLIQPHSCIPTGQGIIQTLNINTEKGSLDIWLLRLKRTPQRQEVES